MARSQTVVIVVIVVVIAVAVAVDRSQFAVRSLSGRRILQCSHSCSTVVVAVRNTVTTLRPRLFALLLCLRLLVLLLCLPVLLLCLLAIFALFVLLALLRIGRLLLAPLVLLAPLPLALSVLNSFSLSCWFSFLPPLVRAGLLLLFFAVTAPPLS